MQHSGPQDGISVERVRKPSEEVHYRVSETSREYILQSDIPQKLFQEVSEEYVC